MNARTILQQRLDAFRAKMSVSFPADGHDMALLQILRCVDDESFSNYIYQNAGQKRPDAEYYADVSRYYGWGLSEALSRFWPPSGDLPGFHKFETSDTLFKWADSVLQCSGRLRLIEQFVELDRIQLGGLTHTGGDSSEFDFYLAADAIGIEATEREEGNYFAEKVGRFFEKSGAWEKLEQRRPAVMEEMEKLVDFSPNQFIRYDTSPNIDAFYSDLATLTAPTREGWDAFPLDANFGGFKFVDYLECVRILMGFAYKHMDYCVLLTNRFKHVKPIDVMAIPCNWTHACRFMSYAMGGNEADAAKLMEVTAVSSENMKHHFQVPAGPLALHYRFGKAGAVRLITGCLHNPFHFMLRELQRRYRLDWDKAVDSREHLFRSALAHSFVKFNRIVFYSDNVNVVTPLGKTDIDVLALDPGSKSAGIFQLKWQDPFCGSMRERESRKKNFLEKGNEWVAKVFSWAGGPEMSQTLASLGLSRQVAEEYKQVKVFVLGRNFSQFSGSFQTDARAAWGHWSQVQRLLESIQPDAPKPLDALFEHLKEEIPAERAPKMARVGELRLGDIKVRIHPAP